MKSNVITLIVIAILASCSNDNQNDIQETIEKKNETDPVSRTGDSSETNSILKDVPVTLIPGTK